MNTDKWDFKIRSFMFILFICGEFSLALSNDHIHNL